MNTINTIRNESDSLLFSNTYESRKESQELLLIPDNYAEIIIPACERQVKIRIIGTARLLELKKGAYFLAPRRRGMEVYLDSNTHLTIIKLNPIYTKHICDRLDEVFTGIFEFNWDDKAFEELKRDAKQNNPYRLLKRLSNHFLGECMDREINPTIQESISRIKDTSGAIKIKDLYTNLNISKSKLEKHFNNELRMTPKEFCKIEKINHFIKSYHEGFNQNLTELTYKCGYYDQSHLIKDFKYFLDTSPKRYFTQLQ